MNRIPSPKFMALGVAVLFAALPSVNAISTTFVFTDNPFTDSSGVVSSVPGPALVHNWTRGSDASLRTVDGITLDVTDGSGLATKVNQSLDKQGLGATTLQGVAYPGFGGALDPGESLIFSLSQSGSAVDAMLTSLVMRFATDQESYEVDILAQGGVDPGVAPVSFTFPTGTVSNNLNPFDLSSANLIGSSFQLENTSPLYWINPGDGSQGGVNNIRIAAMTFNSVPDGGITLMLLGLGLGGLAILRRKLT